MLQRDENILLSFDRVYETAKEDYPRVKAWILGILPEE